MSSSVDPGALVPTLARAKAYYNNKQYSKAAAIFKQIANSCACGVHVRVAPCCCKSLVPAIANGAIEAELRKKCICSAKSDIRCKVTSHLDALDGLAAVYEAKRPLDPAIIIAEAMINLAPREPKGFLRLGRLLRLQRSYRQAYQIYQQGIELVSKKNPSHQLLPPLLKSFKKLEKSTDYWRQIDPVALAYPTFRPLQEAVRPAHLQRYATYSGSQVTELCIKDYRGFNVDWNTFNCIAASYPSLRVLKLRASRHIELRHVGRAINSRLHQLTSLYLGFQVPFSAEFVHKIVASSAATLQELTLLNFPSRPWRRIEDTEIANWPVLQRLRVLRLSGDRDQNMLYEPAILNMPSFVRTTPYLEEFWADGIDNIVIGPFGDGWPRMKKLFLSRDVVWSVVDGAAICPLSGIEELYVMNTRQIGNFLCREAHPEPKGLRRFIISEYYSVSQGWPEYLEKWVRPGLESGSLKELGLQFSKPHPDWLRSDQLTFLRLAGLSAQFGIDPYVLDEALYDLLERFPNLEGLDISQEPFTDGALVRAIQKGVKVIYHRGDFHHKTEVREWALKTHNARVIEGGYGNSLAINPEEQRVDYF
ncbi:hypothetical protein EKO27_g5590 [Xylaria grammica]|uniref:Uncharacterized protein n=1 Tax=Xylaria grammica TaxID=363999 RepID=A0A439D533_9PEZI|nr:hypothetical protein EKO27_g5590 [Xylaria grammica]